MAGERRNRVLAAVLGAVIITNGCAGAGAGTDTPRPPSPPAPTEASASTGPLPAAVEAPSGTVLVAGAITPAASVAVPANFMMATWEDDVLVSGDGAVVRIDSMTNETRRIPVPIGKGNWGGFAVADGALWTTDVEADLVYRIDPETGATTTLGVHGRPHGPIVSGDDLWVIPGMGDGMVRIDPDQMAIADAIEAQGYPYGGSIWVADPLRTVRRMSTANDEQAAVTLQAPAGACHVQPLEGVTGLGNVLVTSCFGNPRQTLIDPATNAVATTIELPGGVDGWTVIDGEWWVILAATENEPARLADVASDGSIRRLHALPDGFAPVTTAVTSDALWLSGEHNGEVLRIALEDLRVP